MASDVAVELERREDADTSRTGEDTAKAFQQRETDSWRSQHARKVAERRERWEQERLQAEKLQQHLDHRESERRRRREHLYHIPRGYSSSKETDSDKALHLRSGRRDGRDGNEGIAQSGESSSGARVRSGSSMQLVSQLNERKNQLEARVKEMQRKLQEERRGSEREMELLRQSHETYVEEWSQKAQKAEKELAQYKKNEGKWKKQLEVKSALKDATAAKMAQLEEEKVHLRSKLERHGSVKRKVEIIEQKAMELEKENLRLHSQLARELHRVKTEVDARIAVQQEKLKLHAQLEDEAEMQQKNRVRMKQTEREVEKLKSEKQEADDRCRQIESDLASQLDGKDEEIRDLKAEVYRLQQQCGGKSAYAFPSRTERCRSLGDVSNLDYSGHRIPGVQGKVTELQLFAERAYQAKADAEERAQESEKLRVKLKNKYREEIQFLRQMNIKLASNEAKLNDSTDVLEMIRNLEEKLDGFDELEKEIDELQLAAKDKDHHISHLEWQLIDKDTTIASLLSERERQSAELAQSALHLRRRPEYRSSSSFHSHLTTPTLVACDSRQTLLASSDSMNSLTSAFNYDGYEYGDARTDAEKINGRSASANAHPWPSRLQPLRRTNSEGNSPVFGGLKNRFPSIYSSSQASMDVAREAQAVYRGLEQLMQSSDSLDHSSGGGNNEADGKGLQRSASADPLPVDESVTFLPSFSSRRFDLRLSGLHRRRLTEGDPGHSRQSSGDSHSQSYHPRVSSGETDLSSSMPPSPVSSCNTMITRSSASELHYPSSPELETKVTPRRFNGIPTRPIPVKAGSRSPLPQRPLSPRLRDNYFQPLTLALVSDSEDEVGKLHSRQRSGSYESLRTDVSVSTNAVRNLQTRLELIQRSSRYSEHMSTTSGDSSIFELMHHNILGGKIDPLDSYVDSDPEERERLGSTMQYRVMPVVQPAKGGKPSYRSASVGSLETGNLKATRC